MVSQTCARYKRADLCSNQGESVRVRRGIEEEYEENLHFLLDGKSDEDEDYVTLKA